MLKLDNKKMIMKLDKAKSVLSCSITAFYKINFIIMKIKMTIKK